VWIATVEITGNTCAKINIKIGSAIVAGVFLLH
jgi:hypothetical protein